MHKLPIGDLVGLNLNRYEAVIVASQHARHLNNVRIKTLEKMPDNPELEIEARKITMVALKDLLDGNVKFQRKETI